MSKCEHEWSRVQGDWCRRCGSLQNAGLGVGPTPPALSQESVRSEVEEKDEIIRVLREEMARIALAVGRSKDGTGFDVDWYELHQDVRALQSHARLAEGRAEICPACNEAILPSDMTFTRDMNVGANAAGSGNLKRFHSRCHALADVHSTELRK